MNETIRIVINVIAKSIAAFFLLSRVLSILWFIDYINYSTILDFVIIASLIICLIDFAIRKIKFAPINLASQAVILASIVISIYQFSRNINPTSILLFLLLVATLIYHFSRLNIKSR